MKPQFHLILGWAWILLGFVSGMVLGMYFHGEKWLGGYASFKRRMYRLGHISFFGLGMVNFIFAMTLRNLSLAGPLTSAASWAFIVGALTMPLCCGVAAHLPKAHLIFAVPVVALILGGVLTMTLMFQEPKQTEPANTPAAIALNDQPVTLNQP